MPDKCSKCGQALSQDDMFCGGCGAKVEAIATAGVKEATAEIASPAEARAPRSTETSHAVLIGSRIALVAAACISALLLTSADALLPSLRKFVNSVVEIIAYHFNGDYFYLVPNYTIFGLGLLTGLLSILIAYILHSLIDKFGYQVFLTAKQFLAYVLPIAACWVLLLIIIHVAI